MSNDQKWAVTLFVGMLGSFVIGWWGGNRTGHVSGFSEGVQHERQSESRVLGRMDELGVLKWCDKAREIIRRGDAPDDWKANGDTT
jgi:hypothetical protein